MTPFRSLSILCNAAFITALHGCSTTSTPVPVFTNGGMRESAKYQDAKSREYQKQIFSQYCQQGRQIKLFSYALRFIKPALPKKIPLDKAHSIIESISDVRECSVKTSLIQLSQHCD